MRGDRQPKGPALTPWGTEGRVTTSRSAAPVVPSSPISPDPSRPVLGVTTGRVTIRQSVPEPEPAIAAPRVRCVRFLGHSADGRIRPDDIARDPSAESLSAGVAYCDLTETEFEAAVRQGRFHRARHLEVEAGPDATPAATDGVASKRKRKGGGR